uniref:MADS-box transcription factor n=1 Tax=Cyclamen persicum TaxID=87530 RepID=F1T119_9ERIC|nr:MADS-box transcription factor [Cyclamen persicum]
MGRRKLEIKRIEDKSSRQVTFSKRRNGLIKKARELSVLCEADVSLLVFSARGKLYEFSSSQSLDQIIQRYKSSCVAVADGIASEDQVNIFGNFGTSSELLEGVERYLEEAHLEKLSVTDLVQLESEVDAALRQIKSRKTQLLLQSITALNQEETRLTEQNKRLVAEVAGLEKDHDANEATEQRPMLLLF